MVNLNQQIKEAMYIRNTTETVNLINKLTFASRILTEENTEQPDSA